MARMFVSQRHVIPIAYRLRVDRRSEEPEQEKAAAESCTSTEGADGRRQLCTRDM